MSDRNAILVVDDEPGLRMMLADFLRSQGYEVELAAGGVELDGALGRRRPDLILLDVNMPGEDGFSIARRLRARGEPAGIIMLTAADDLTSRLTGLRDGADDYIAKPFELRELLARVRSVLRRLPGQPVLEPVLEQRQELMRFGRCRLDPLGRRLLDEHDQEVAMSAMEFELLTTFARHPRQVLSRERLVELAHGRPLGDGDRSVDVRITRLRKRIEPDPAQPRVLCTVRGEGYLFDPDAA